MNTDKIVSEIVERILAAPYGEAIVVSDEVNKLYPNAQWEYRGPDKGHVMTDGGIEIRHYDLFDIDLQICNTIEASTTHFFDDSETAAMCLGLPFHIHKKIRTYSGLLDEFTICNSVVVNGNLYKGALLDEMQNRRYLITIPPGNSLRSEDFRPSHVICWHVVSGTGFCNGETISKGSSELFGNTPFTDDIPVKIENVSDNDLVIYLVDKVFGEEELSVDEYIHETLLMYGLAEHDLTEEQLKCWREDIESTRAGGFILDGVESELPLIALDKYANSLK